MRLHMQILQLGYMRYGTRCLPNSTQCIVWMWVYFQYAENLTYETESESEISSNDEYEDLPFASGDNATDEEAIDDEQHDTEI